MKHRFSSAEQVLQSPLFDFSAPAGPLLFQNRCTRGTHLDDMIFRDLHGSYGGGESLLRDTFQALYAPELQPTEPCEQTVQGRELYRPLLSKLMTNENFPALKAVCEGSEQAAYAAAKAFAKEAAPHLDDLRKSVDRLTHVLEKLTARNSKASAELHRQKTLADLGAAQEQVLIDAAITTASTGEQIRAVTRMLRDTLHQQRNETAQVISAAIVIAAEEAQFVHDAALCWGNDEGCGEKNSVDQDLLKRLRSNETLRGITRQLGRMKEMLSDLRKNAYAYGRGEKYSLTQGRDMKNVLSAELALLASPDTTPIFIKRYNAKSLRQYARRDSVRKGHGDVIVCLDESSSTRGTPAIWGKALAIALQDICAHEGRRFALIHFASASNIKTDLFLPNRYGAAELMNAAAHFFGGGTDFEAPLREAFRVMEENTFENADILFVTDGACSVSDALAAELQAIQAEKHCSVIGLLLDTENPERPFSLEQFCERVYRVSELAAEDIEQDLFKELTA